jgi:hypothetical protein
MAVAKRGYEFDENAFRESGKCTKAIHDALRLDEPLGERTSKATAGPSTAVFRTAEHLRSG